MIRVNPYRINLIPLDMNSTRQLCMRASANKVVLVASSAFIGLVTIAELVKNGLKVIANVGIVLINFVTGKIFQVNRVARAPLQTAVRTEGNARRINESSPIDVPLGQEGRFATDDMIAFRQAIHSYRQEAPMILVIQNHRYDVWFNPANEHICVQPDEHFGRGQQGLLEVNVSPLGRILSVRIEGVNQNSTVIPSDYDPQFTFGFRKALEISSKYNVNGNIINIDLIPRGLKEVPEFHLTSLANMIRSYPLANRTFVRFLRNNQARDNGADAGGLSRDYFDDLFNGITRCQDIQFFRDRARRLFLPVVGRYQNGRFPVLERYQQNLLESIGSVLMFIYTSPNNYLTGKRFPQALFNAAFSLTTQELDTPFDRLSMATKLKMREEFLKAKEESTTLVEILKGMEDFSDDDWRNAATYAEYSGNKPESFNVAQFDPRNEEHKQMVRNILNEDVFAANGEGNSLAPIHAIAKGIRARQIANHPYAVWPPCTPRAFSNKVQGYTDPREVVNQIRTDGHGLVPQKVQWLKEWIAEEASEEEVEAFIKFATGSSSMLPDDEIRVVAQFRNFIPMPVGHSCFKTIDISPVPAPPNPAPGDFNDHTKPSFITALKEVLSGPTGYSNA